MTCALTTGISRHRAAYSGTGDGTNTGNGTPAALSVRSWDENPDELWGPIEPALGPLHTQKTLARAGKKVLARARFSAHGAIPLQFWAGGRTPPMGVRLLRLIQPKNKKARASLAGLNPTQPAGASRHYVGIYK
jgi:hypothetical protein